MKRLSMALGGALALAACGGGSPGSSPTTAQLAAYRSSALAASSAVTTYQTAAGTMTTQAGCQAATQQYAAQMQQAIQEMQQSAGMMDDGMMSFGQGPSADVACGVALMGQQVAQQQVAACASADVAPDQAQIQLHVQTMQQLADHLQMRGAEMDQLRATMMGGSGGGMMGGTSGGMMSGSWQGPAGQTVSFGQPLPGCPATSAAPAPVPPPGSAT